MPFVLSPNFSKLFNKTNISKTGRLHNDGINYDINSPEALDEIFFRNDDEESLFLRLHGHNEPYKD